MDIESLEKMLAAGHDNALLRQTLATEHLKAEHVDRAVEHADQAVVLDPAYSAAWKIRGRALAAAGREAEAAEAYERGITVAEENGDVQAAKEMRVFLKRLRKDAS